MKRRHYNNGQAEFILEPVSPSLVKVAHRDQTGWFGLNSDWDVHHPYAWTTMEFQATDDGIAGPTFCATTPDRALRGLCREMLDDQRREDSKRVNPEERQEAARQVLREFLEELSE